MAEEILIGLVATVLGVGFLVLPVLVFAMVIGIRRRLTEMREVQDRMASDLRMLRRGHVAATRDASAPEPARVAEPVPPAAPVQVPVMPELPPAVTVACEPAHVEPVPPSPLPPPLPPPVLEPVAAEVQLPSVPEPLQPEPEPEPSGVEVVLRRIWAWILMGGEHRLEGTTLETAIATWWLLLAGIGAFVLCAGYFLKWSYDKGLIGPAGRVGITVFFGVALLVGGLRMLGKRYNLIGQGFLGGGLLILYFSIFTAVNRYDLIGHVPGFALMALVTGGACVLAVRTNSLLVALLGLAGGFLTPVMMRTPTPNLPALYAYILMLDLGIMGVARRRDWQALNYAAFVLTYLLFWGSKSNYDTSLFPVAMVFLSLFFAVHSWICYTRTVGGGRAAGTPDIMHLALNAGAFAGSGYSLIREAYGRPYPALLAVSLAAFYVLHLFVFIRLKISDRRLLAAFLGLASLFAAWTLPLVFEKETLTLALALAAFMFLWMGRRLESGFLGWLGQALYMVVFLRLVFWDMRRGFSGAAVAGNHAEYWKGLLGRLMTSGVSIGSFVAAHVAEFRAARREADAENGKPVGAQPGNAAWGFHWVALILVFIFLHREVSTMFGCWPTFLPAAVTVVWCAVAAYLLQLHLSGRPGARGAYAVMCVLIFLAAAKLIVRDTEAWGLTPYWVYRGGATAKAALARFLDFAAVTALCLAVFRWIGLKRRAVTSAVVFGYSALLLVFMYATAETSTALFHYLPRFRAGGVSVLWALFAISFVAGGIWKNSRSLRYTGLALFAVVLGKVFLSDLARMEMVYRVIAFMAVGTALLLGSFAYLRAGKKRDESPNGPDDGDNGATPEDAA
ncbi:MAG: DUF2339 domain-containing protein [Lentisphaerae bacterium]|nr:DUF2339 domain-containing protein [Lentisphaerota bacterium]